MLNNEDIKEMLECLIIDYKEDYMKLNCIVNSMLRDENCSICDKKSICLLEGWFK